MIIFYNAALYTIVRSGAMATDSRARGVSKRASVTTERLLYAASIVNLGVNLSLSVVSWNGAYLGASTALYLLNAAAIVMLLALLAIPPRYQTAYHPRASLMISFLFVVTGTAIGSVLILSIMAVLAGGSPVHGAIILTSCILATAMYVGIVLLRR